MSEALRKPLPLEAGHPLNHGFVKCADCGCWRRVAGGNLVSDMVRDPTGNRIVCLDVYGCSRWRAERLALTKPEGGKK